MKLSGQMKWLYVYLAMQVLCGGIFGSILLAFLVLGLQNLSVAAHDHAAMRDPAVTSGMLASVGCSAIAAYAIFWQSRRVLRTVRWFEFDGEALRYKILGSRQEFQYRKADIKAICRRGGGGRFAGRNYWYEITFRDRNWLSFEESLENQRELLRALIGDSKPSFMHNLLDGAIYEAAPEADAGRPKNAP